MFESAVMGPTLRGPPPGLLNSVGSPEPFSPFGHHELDRSQMAEALVFYDEVHLIGSGARFLNLIYNIGPGQFQRLLESKRVKLALTQSRTVSGGGSPGGRVFLFHNDFPVTPAKNLEDLAHRLHEASKRKGREDASRLIDYISTGRADSLTEDKAKMASERYSSLIDLAKTRPSVIAELLKAYLSALYPTDDFGSLRFEYEGEMLGKAQFRVLHELPLFGREEIHFFTSALFDIFMVLDEFAIAMSSSGEFAVDPAMGAALRQLAQGPLTRTVPQEQIDMFTEFVLKGRSVGSAIVMDHTFDELLLLLEKKGRFSKWLKSQTLEKGLVQAWIDHISNETWIDKLPGKTARFFTTTGLGLAADVVLGVLGVPSVVGTAAGVGVGAFDTLVIDSFRKGWKPNQFVTELAAFSGSAMGPTPKPRNLNR
jgi:hypothetical protein